ncbi:MAG: single-stranded-DNA-specific exonuclease RecJ [Burkholderiales bacterium]|nr:MAG: single-stranded-DNA-specific exonuclease RecJ [Burkholderiales bacterium]
MIPAPRLALRRVDPRALANLTAAGVSPLMARLYAGRGVEGAASIGGGPADLLAPQALRGAAEAARLLADAIAARRRLLIVGDYDCDGATGVAVGVLGLRMLGAVVDYLVPNRFDHGYGLTPEIVDVALAHPRLGRPDVLITVDNGIASLEGVARAQAAGLQVVVTDHHLPGPTLPAADALVNPNQPGCTFPSKHLAGVGVMFYVLIALRAELRTRGAWAGRSEPALAELLDLVALGTVADVVRLDRNNRLLVAAGLKRLRAGRARPGLLALLRLAGREPREVGSLDLGFALGPRINAAGRLADISLGVECLLEDDAARADAIAQQLDDINRERREIETDMRDEALADVGEPDPEGRTLVAFRPGWHQGVIGLVASRLKDRHGRPTLALARDERVPGTLKGSGRSIPGVHLRDVLDLVDRRAPGVLMRFGGHAMAAGLTMAEEGLPRLCEAFESAVRELADPASFSPVLETDGPLAPEDLNAGTVAEIDHEVWGQGFPAPLFADRFEVLSQRLVKDRHLKLELRLGNRRVAAIVFGRTEPVGRDALLAYQLQRDTWQGADGVSLIVRHCA